MTNETTASQPTPHQNTLDAITGAIAYGRQGTNPPPSPDHWLAEYWSIGQQLAELGKTSAWDNVTPTASQQKSIGDDAQFRKLMLNFMHNSTITLPLRDQPEYCAIAAYIDSKLRAPADQAASVAALQQRVQPWMMACFGEEISGDKMERNHRFFEEATELVQAGGMTQSEAHQLVDYTFGRPVGELPQEVGGVMVTLAALCLAHGVDMHVSGEVELARIWTKVEAIRAKQAAKPRHSPLPVAAQSADKPAMDLSALPVYYMEGLENGGYYLRTDVNRALAVSASADGSEAGS